MAFPKIDQAAVSRIFFGLLAAAFVLLTALGIHGSSVVIWSAILKEDATAQALIFSKPRQIRSDEWLVVTPSVLAQARHEPSFPVENPALGAGRSPMLMNLPTRHFSTAFRPQMWGYFLFDVEHGFAWDWNVKIFGLLAATFLLLRTLTGGNAWLGVFGALWVYASAYVQWWFSCPPMLPEMLASWALALWCVINLLEAPRWPAALGLTIGLVLSSVNFALSMYPPYQIPLAYLGLAVLGGWIWQQSGQPVGGTAPRHLVTVGWLALAAALAAAVIVPFFIELLPTLHLVQNTSYPGARRTTGGALGTVDLFLGLADPFMSADYFPEKRGNICNASNFYPIWFASGLWLIATVGRNPRARLLWPLFLCLVGYTIFALCPLPAFVGRLTLLSFTTEERLIMPIGFGGVLLSVLVLREILENGAALPATRRWALLAICAGAALALLLAAATENPKFFTNTRLAGSIALSLALFAAYLWPVKNAFPLLLLAALLPSAIRVNPVAQGLAPLKDSTAFQAVEEIRRADPEACWMAFDGANQSSFLMSAGVNVLSGAKTLPNLAFYAEIDPEQRSLEIYNRYSLGLFHLAPQPDLVRFKLFNFCAHNVWIHPTHPALRSRQVRYFVFPEPLQDPGSTGLKPLRALPDRKMWIYQLAQR